LDRALFDRWLKAKSRFRWKKPDGDYENGEIHFRSHTFIGSSLHKGYDIQGPTGVWRLPRLQFNYRYSDSEADIDLDGYSPLFDPKHLTYPNSDPRQWFDKIIKRFGDPGFRVQPY
jgi:hypothetical protein